MGHGIGVHPIPQLSIGALLYGIVGPRVLAEEELAQPWVRSGDTALWTSKSAWSLALLVEFRRRALGQVENGTVREIEVWLPAFFCDESLGPMRSLGASLRFFDVDEQLNPNAASVRALSLASKPDILVGVHYFGQPADLSLLHELAESCGAWLVEDAAHVLTPEGAVGTLGDFVLYSPHKHVAAPDGAVLVIRRHGPSRIGDVLRSLRMELDQIIARQPGRRSRFLGNLVWVAKRLAHRLGFARQRASEAPPERLIEVARASSSGQMPPLAISNFSRRLLRHQLTSLERYQLARRSNWLKWREQLDPWLKPIAGEHLRDSVAFTPYLASMGENCPAATFDALSKAHGRPVRWPNLPPEVLGDPEAYPIAFRQSRSLVHLPLHQDVHIGAITRASKRFRRRIAGLWTTREVTQAQWAEYWDTALLPNLVQSWEYGEAVSKVRGGTVSRRVIEDESGRPVALAQGAVQSKTGIDEICIVNQGPIWIQKVDEHPRRMVAAVQALRSSRKGLRPSLLVCSPPVPDSRDLTEGLRATRFYRLNRPSWASARIDLGMSIETLRANLHGKWRNGLRKAERLDLLVRSHPGDLTYWNDAKAMLDLLRKERGSVIIQPELLDEIVRQPASPTWSVQLLTAHRQAAQETSPILASVLVVCSGSVATYLMGASSEEGRRCNATSLLLWEAITTQKSAGTAWFDLGGLSTSTPDGIARFKQGVGGVPYTSAGYFLSLNL